MGDSNLNSSIASAEDNNDDENDAPTCTMLDWLKEQDELEEDANAVLGGSDAKNCTYPEGYVKRQALYACLTCLPENGDDTKCAGICLACSYVCHEKHNLIELYTKRNFRCDCGNSLFGSKKCSLKEDKESINEKNKYSQNFRGTYCTCARPYPDPEDDEEDSMIQCIICEDWYHTRHLGCSVPPEDFGELICKLCMNQHKFLQQYSGLCVTKVSSEKSENGIVVEEEKCTPSESKSSVDTSASAIKVNDCPSENQAAVDNGQSVAITNGSSEQSTADKSQECTFAKMKDIEKPLQGATFWPDQWRKHLCTCANCKAMYIEEGVEFLLDQQDTVHAYEEKGKMLQTGEGSQYDKAMDALRNMDRVTQVEAISGYNDLKESFLEYLRTFAERKRVVREEDIREFFTTMQARKRQRIDMSHSCR